MISREYYWGFFFLFAAVIILFIGIWKFVVYIEHSYVLLFKIWEYIFYSITIVFVFISIASMIKSFYYARRDLTGKKTVRPYVKIIVLLAVLYNIYNIFLIIDVIERWE
ncbi:MAG: hypothetical protein ACFFA6_10835 [Promethearchaeota archaeon]